MNYYTFFITEKFHDSIINNDIMKYIEKIVLSEFKLSNFNILTTKSRDHKFVSARRLFCVLMLKYTRLSTSKIGKYINRDHATVLHLNKKHNDFMFSDKVYKKRFNEILTKFK